MTESGSYAIFLICALLIAMSYGGSMGVFPALTSDAFGLKNNGVNYGIMFIGFALGGYLGPVIANSLFDSTGSYSTALLVVGAMGVAATLLVLWLTKINKSKKKSA